MKIESSESESIVELTHDEIIAAVELYLLKEHSVHCRVGELKKLDGVEMSADSCTFSLESETVVVGGGGGKSA